MEKGTCNYNRLLADYSSNKPLPTPPPPPPAPGESNITQYGTPTSCTPHILTKVTTEAQAQQTNKGVAPPTTLSCSSSAAHTGLRTHSAFRSTTPPKFDDPSASASGDAQNLLPVSTAFAQTQSTCEPLSCVVASTLPDCLSAGYLIPAHGYSREDDILGCAS